MPQRLARAPQGVAPTITFTAAPGLVAAVRRWQSWLAHERRVSANTIEAYSYDLASFLTFLSHHLGAEPDLADLAALKVADFRAFLARRLMDGISQRSNSRALSAIRGFFGRLDHEKLCHNPALGMLRAHAVGPSEPRPLSVDQARASVATVGDLATTPWLAKRDTALVMLLYGAGLRIGEALGLNLADLPAAAPGSDATLTITGKGGKQRMTPLLAVIRAALEDYIAACPYKLEAGGPLFVGARGGRLNPGVVQRQLRALRGALGLPETATPHALRHSFATHMLAGGAGMRDIQELLGHASLSTTQRYTEVDAASLLKSYAAAHPRAKEPDKGV